MFFAKSANFYVTCQINFRRMCVFLRKYFLLIFLFISGSIIGHEFTPVVTQFSKKDYNAANQNWSVGQASDGTMYFGNNQGLLEFDGTLWKTYKIPGNKIVRSLLIDKNNRIYIGSFEEFGYFEKDNYGQLNYTSLSSGLQNYTMQNDEIWSIHNLDGTIIFQSFTSFFTYKGDKVNGIRTQYTFLLFNVFNHRIYTHTEQKGFSYLDISSNSIVPVANKVLKSPIISILKLNDSTAVLVSKSDGLFLYNGNTISRFKTDADEELKKAEINRAVISPDGYIALGTILNGVTVINTKGEKLWTLNTSNVLQNNTVLGLYCDFEKNLWLALDKGIALFKPNSSISYIHSFNPSVGSIYSVSYSAPNLYIGTNQGLYKSYLNLDKKGIQNIQMELKIKGQVWSIDKCGNQILCGNNEETQEILSSGLSLISPVKGGICIKNGFIHGKEVLVQGTYTQLCIYVKNNGKWVFSNAVESFLNPIKYIEIDYTGTIWASHLHQGLYAITLTPDLKNIESIKTYNTLDNKHIYPINVFSINNRVVFTDNNSFYTFDDIRKEIIPFEELNMSLGYFSRSYRVCHFKSDLYWFIQNNEAALVQVKRGAVKIVDVFQYSLFLNQTIDDNQNVVTVSDDECMFTLENGLVLYKLDTLKKGISSATLQMKSVQTSTAGSAKSTLLSIDSESVPTTPYTHNRIVFTVLYPQFSNLFNVNFRYKLEGLDKLWGEPTTSSTKVYNYLPHGEYVLKVEAITNGGIKLAESSYAFIVEPPFYLSLWAKILYLVLIILFIIALYFYVQHLFLVKKNKIHFEQEEIRKHEIEKRELKIIALKKDKLELELKIKSKELAGSTMTIIKKNEIIKTIKEEVINQKKVLGVQYPNKYYDKLIRLLDENLSSEDDWAIFQTNFDRIHENFFLNLRSKYPELTSNDLRFCAYLHLNLSSKDIAHLMNITPKGVEVGRYRIRKKIGIPSTKSLTEFMIEFK